MKIKQLPPLDVVKSLYAYDPATGTFTWRVDSGNRKAGSPAGGLCEGRTKNIMLRISGELFSASRLAWYMHTGEDPGEMHVDHINRDRTDNRIENLRLTTHRANQYNSKSLGVSLNKRNGKWRSTIYRMGKQLHLGEFECPLLAGMAYLAKRQELLLEANLV